MGERNAIIKYFSKIFASLTRFKKIIKNNIGQEKKIEYNPGLLEGGK